MEIKFNSEDIKLIRKFEEIKNRGYYASGNEVTAVYNRVFGTSLSSTSCGTCLRGRIQQMVDELNRFEEKIKAQEELKEEMVDNVTPEENKASEEAENKSAIKRVGRPPKKK